MLASGASASVWLSDTDRPVGDRLQRASAFDAIANTDSGQAHRRLHRAQRHATARVGRQRSGHLRRERAGRGTPVSANQRRSNRRYARRPGPGRYARADLGNAGALKGKKVGITGPGAATETAAKMALRSLQLDPPAM